MARRDHAGPDWRRRTFSTVQFDPPPLAAVTASPPRLNSAKSVRPGLHRVRLRPLVWPLVALASVATLLWLASSARSPSPAAAAEPAPARKVAAAVAQSADHPNFDFDAHAEATEPPSSLALGDDEDRAAHADADEADAALAGTDDEGSDEAELGDDVEPEHSAPKRLPPTSVIRPFLPFSCAACSPSSSLLSGAPPTCAKYRSDDSSAALPSRLHPGILDHSVLFPGTGAEVRRVLKRAMRSSLYASKRAREGTEDAVQKMEGEEPFRVLVLGGSVSNCRGVDPKTTCWHAHVLRWFQQNLPMEGDRDLVPDVPSLLFGSSAAFGPRLDRRAPPVKRAMPDTASTTADDRPSQARLEKRAAGGRKKKKAKRLPKKPKARTASSRRHPSTRLINGSKSATGSAFFAYCFDEEMTLRRKNLDWGKGPDLIILETGVNDVWPGGQAATRDYEKLLRTLRSMPSNPAIIALEAASLLLASTTGMMANAEYDHLPAAHFYDVPVLSAKHALFGPVSGLATGSSSTADSPTLKINDLFLPDLHHPNEQGHELLADILLSYLEQQACLAQSELLATADARFRSISAASLRANDDLVDPALDFPARADEPVRPLPARSLFDPFVFDKKHPDLREGFWQLPEPRCIQVGNAKTTVEPVKNKGWTKLAWARDKQYLVAENPGDQVTFRVEVGPGGTVLGDWLHSRFYDLGDALAYLDGDRSSAVQLAGWWDLGWSIGVPTELFHGVAAGTHDVTFEILPASRSSHPSKKTNFRLIGLVTT